jgi:hypothetical protein
MLGDSVAEAVAPLPPPSLSVMFCSVMPPTLAAAPLPGSDPPLIVDDMYTVGIGV